MLLSQFMSKPECFLQSDRQHLRAEHCGARPEDTLQKTLKGCLVRMMFLLAPELRQMQEHWRSTKPTLTGLADGGKHIGLLT